MRGGRGGSARGWKGESRGAPGARTLAGLRGETRFLLLAPISLLSPAIFLRVVLPPARHIHPSPARRARAPPSPPVLLLYFNQLILRNAYIYCALSDGGIRPPPSPFSAPPHSPPPPPIPIPSPSPAPPPCPRGGPARVLIANLTSFADSMGFFRHRPMRTIIDDTVGSRPVSIFRRVSSPRTVSSPMADRGDFGCPRLIMRARGTAEKRRNYPVVCLYRCPFPTIFFLPRIFRGASILRSLITIQNNSLKRDTHCNILALLNRGAKQNSIYLFITNVFT